MTLMKTVRRAAYAAIAFGAIAVGVAPAADLSSLTPKARDAVLTALSRGDYDGANRLIAATPGQAQLFGTPVGPAGPDSRFESLRGCGFYPQQTRLECIVELKAVGDLKRPSYNTAYGGLLGSLGSQENVEFCINMWQIDSNPSHFPIWMPLGRGTVIVHDQRQAVGTNPPVRGPWEYAVYRDFDPPSGPRVVLNNAYLTPTQSEGFTYEVKAILWWQLPWENPSIDCNTVPKYGDVQTFLVRGDPIR